MGSQFLPNVEDVTGNEIPRKRRTAYKHPFWELGSVKVRNAVITSKDRTDAILLKPFAKSLLAGDASPPPAPWVKMSEVCWA